VNHVWHHWETFQDCLKRNWTEAHVGYYFTFLGPVAAVFHIRFRSFTCHFVTAKAMKALSRHFVGLGNSSSLGACHCWSLFGCWSSWQTRCRNAMWQFGQPSIAVKKGIQVKNCALLAVLGAWWHLRGVSELGAGWHGWPGKWFKKAHWASHCKKVDQVTLVINSRFPTR